MFPFTPIDQQSVVYGAWGSPLHGLYEFYFGDPAAVDLSIVDTDRSGVITFVDDPPVRVARTHEHWTSTAAARLVDTGSTFERNPNLEEFDLARGNEWRDKAIVNGIGFAARFYTRLNTANAEWVYTAPDKSRWSITATFSYFEPNRITGSLVATPFGEFKYLNEFWGIVDQPDDDFPEYTFEIDGSAGVSDSTGTNFDPYVLDISNDGTMALVALGRPASQLYALFDQIDLENPRNFRKSGAEAMGSGFPNHQEVHAIHLFTLSGKPNDPDDPFMVDLSIYKDQVAASGTIENDQDDEVSFRVWSAYYTVTTGDIGLGFTRPFFDGVPPGSGESTVAATLPHIKLSLLPDPEAAEILAFCGWTREDCEGNNHVEDDPFNPTNTRWIRHTGDPDQTDDGDVTEWELSVEYKVPPAFPDEDFVKYNGFVFEVTVDHTSDPVVQPGVGGAWQDNWKVLFDDPEMDIGDIPLWAQETTYNSFDAVHDAGFEYYLAVNKGAHESDDADESINEPGVGSDWENFWDGPFLVAVEDFWVSDRLFFEGWVIRHEYTEPAFSGDADLDINTARFRVIRSHVSSEITEPGHGENWRIYWEKANEVPSAQDEWVPPVEYEIGDRVDNTTGDELRYTCILPHTSTDSTQPPGANWFEGEQPIDCPSLLDTSIGGVAYHLGRGGTNAPANPTKGRTGHKASNLDIDFHVKDVYVWANFKDDNSIYDYTVDLRYEQTKRDLELDFCWSAPGRTGLDQPLGMRPDDVDTYTGRINRGPSTVDEKLTYIFKTDGTERHEITIIAEATASGEDLWTENFSTYPLTWDPSGSRTLQVFLEGELYGSVNNNFTDADFGNTDFPPGSFQKQDWGPDGANNDFCGGLTFQYIDNTYLDAILDDFRNAFNSDIRAFPGPHLTSLVGGTVTLDPINPTFNAQFDSRPQRTQREKDEGDPPPGILTVIYSPKLIGPLVAGRKRHFGFGFDGQYLNILEPNDFPWQQFGLFGPDAEVSGKVTLTERSPTTGVTLWLQNADYGDDISCAYDPFTHTIHRNSQYKVVYL